VNSGPRQAEAGRVLSPFYSWISTEHFLCHVQSLDPLIPIAILQGPPNSVLSNQFSGQVQKKNLIKNRVGKNKIEKSRILE
jgi:hypothetical protein